MEPLQASDASSFDHGALEQTTHDPARLALWTEFHQRVDSLPDLQKTVFEMHYYGGLTQAEVARTLELEPKKVSRLWIAATESLADGMSNFDFF